MSFTYAPKGWAFCNGQTLPIAQNQALFSLLSTNYGGNGQTTFGLPNLQGKTAIHVGSGFALAQTGGEAAHTLTIGEMPAHTHAANAVNAQASAGYPSNTRLLSQSNAPNSLYAGATNLTPMSADVIGNQGSSQPHQNMQPYLPLNFCIALQGIYPSRS